MNLEAIDLDRIPSNEIATWLAKVDRAKFALKEQRIVTDEDGQAVYGLVGTDSDPSIRLHWTDVNNRGVAYESAILYELAGNLSLSKLKRVLELPRAPRIDPLVFPESEPANNKELNLRARFLSNQALLAGLGRLGMIEPNVDGAVSAPDGLIAALLYQRANIRRQPDRHLYERADEIDSIKHQIEQEVPPRTMQISLTNNTTTTMSIYQGLIYSKHPDPSSNSEINELSEVGRLWLELNRDFRRIEECASSLQTSPV